MKSSENLLMLLERRDRLYKWSKTTDKEIALVLAERRYESRQAIKEELHRLGKMNKPPKISNIEFLIGLEREALATLKEAQEFGDRSGEYLKSFETKKLFFASYPEEREDSLQLAERLVDIMKNPRERKVLIEQGAVTDWTDHIRDMQKLSPVLSKIADLFEEYVENLESID